MLGRLLLILDFQRLIQSKFYLIILLFYFILFYFYLLKIFYLFRYVTSSDDKTAKIFDFSTGLEEVVFDGKEINNIITT